MAGEKLMGALAKTPSGKKLQRLSPGVYRGAGGQLVSQSGRPIQRPGAQRPMAQKPQPRPSDFIQLPAVSSMQEGLARNLAERQRMMPEQRQFVPSQEQTPPWMANPGMVNQPLQLPPGTSADQIVNAFGGQSFGGAQGFNAGQQFPSGQKWMGVPMNFQQQQQPQNLQYTGQTSPNIQGTMNQMYGNRKY